MRRACLAIAASIVALACDVGATPRRPDAGPPIDAGAIGGSCVDEEVVRARVFAPHCATADCHAGPRPEGGLDLDAAGLATRLASATSIQEGCEGRPLIVPGDARSSYLMDKVIGAASACGDPMPADGALALEDRRCLVVWIDGLGGEL
ncbi:MAG: c-type cytochrome domain-containing protein [Sandaracinaceae bacterium]